MKPFNDPELNKGFQLDTSLLNPEQIEHVLKIFEARGINFHIGKPTKIKLDFSKNKIIEFEDGVLYQPDCSVKLKTPLIDYPTLCRGAVQLEPNTFAVSNFEKIDSLLGYAASIEMGTYFVSGCDTHILIDGSGLYSSTYATEEKTKISPEDFEAKLKGIYPVVKQSLTTETDYAPRSEAIHSEVKEHMIADAADRLGFEFENTSGQPKETIEDCGEKTLMDNPTIADHIGSHINLAFEYAKELVNENTRLEQENAELKERIAELEAKLKQNAEPVYDAEWLANLVNNYDDIYWLDGAILSVGGITMSGKDSAPIIIAALAKHLNPLFEADGRYSWEIMFKNREYSQLNCSIAANINGAVFTSKEAAQEAIDILSQIAPEVLKNYLV